MATGDITTLAIDTTGKSLSGVVEGLTAASVTTLDQIIKVEVAGGNARTLAFRTFVSTVDSAGNTAFTVSGLDPVLTGETVTVSIPAAAFDDGTNTSNAVASGATTNNSTATKDADALTVFAGAPVAAWALRDKQPIGASFDIDTVAGTVTIDTETAFSICLHAVDNWAGIEYVEFTFSGTTPVTTSANVTDQGSNVYRVLARTLIDPFQDSNGSSGVSRYLWVVPLDLSAASNGATYTVSGVTVRTKDGVNHAMITDGHLTSRVVVVLKSGHTLKYLDAAATGAGDGTSWTDAWTDLPDTGAAAANLPSTTDIVFCRAGNYTMPTNLRFSGSKFCRFIPVEAGVVFESSRNSADTIGSYMQLGYVGAPELELYRSHATTTTTWRGDNTSWNGLENVHSLYASVAPTGSNGPHWSFSRPSHMSIVKSRQTKGYRGFAVGYASSTFPRDLLWWGVEVTNSGTCFSGAVQRGLFVGLSAISCATSTEFNTGTHFDGLHTGVAALTNGLQNAIVDGFFAYACGNQARTDSYNTMLASYGGTNVAMLGIRFYGYTALQQILQFEGNLENWQVVGVTALDTEGVDGQGFNLSGKDATNPYVNNKFLIRNCAANSIASTVGSHASGQAPGDGANTTARLLGPNVYAWGTGESGASALLTVDGSDTIGGATSVENADFDLADLASTPPDMAPTATSPLFPTDVIAAAAVVDYPWDAIGAPLANDGTDAVGAIANYAVTLLTPADAATGIANPVTPTWSGGTANYTLQVNEQSLGTENWADPTYEATGIATTSHQIASTLAAGLYYWRVVDANGVTSEVWEFTIADGSGTTTAGRRGLGTGLLTLVV
jgi:hypothetical protein